MTENSDLNNNYKFLLNIINCATKYAQYFPFLTQTADEVYMRFDQLFLNCSIQNQIHTDNKCGFRNRQIAFLTNKFKTLCFFDSRTIESHKEKWIDSMEQLKE